MNKYYRKPWNKENIEILLKWWPHWGTDILYTILSLTKQQIKSKVNKLELKLLPKIKRICCECKDNYQFSRAYGLLCRECFLKKRKLKKIEKDKEKINKLNIPQEIMNHLIEFYPHFGLKFTQDSFKESNNYNLLDIKQILKLKRLDKKDRLCILCLKNKQTKKGGFYCRTCYNSLAYHKRRVDEVTVETRLRELLRTAKYRSSVESDITPEYLFDLYKFQDGKCFYTGIQMTNFGYGVGRHQPYTISIDQIEAGKGYTKNNVVLCCWMVNSSKNEHTVEDFIKISELIVSRKDKIISEIEIIKNRK